MSTEQKCRVCGCTENNACVKGGVACHWVAPDLCSHCAPTPRMVLEAVATSLAGHFNANVYIIVQPAEGLTEIVAGVCVAEKYPLHELLRKMSEQIVAGQVAHELPSSTVSMKSESEEKP